jgi:hypothetical protein
MPESFKPSLSGSDDASLSEGGVLEKNYHLILQSLLLDLCRCACESSTSSSAVADRGEMNDLVLILSSDDDQVELKCVNVI